MGREERVARKVLAKDSSVIVADFWGVMGQAWWVGWIAITVGVGTGDAKVGWRVGVV